MNRLLNPDLDLSVSRIIKAPRQAVWRAWTTPERFEQWWIPKPTKCKVVEMDLKPGGSFITQMSDNGDAFQPHVTGCFLAVDEMERIVFTDALLGGWRPAEQSFLTAVITFKEHADGTDYSAYAMHKSQTDRKTHEEMGFHDGWGTVTRQLAELVER
jgi:uncharacterized protein YndB with AHSA1/START domain